MKKQAKKKVEEEDNSLEIISIGVLYQGPWDKKYWSCSRGKDRYPYPVGYQAIRAHNGIACKLEIREGVKGPLFVITSVDEQSFSEQTADIAWEKFQKQGLPRVKLLPGKRLSCKIDGVEFFGFKNPFVQRLLRELVANVDGREKRSLPPSSSCNKTFGKEPPTQSSDSCIYPDSQQYLAKPSVTGKRSKKLKKINTNTINGDIPKKDQSVSLTCNDEDLHVRQRNRRDNTDKNLKPFFETKEDSHPGASPVSGKLETLAMGKNTSISSPGVLPNKKMSDENTSIGVRTGRKGLNFSQLDRSRGCVVLDSSKCTALEESSEEAPLLKGTPKINDEGLCGPEPDTLEELHDDTSDSAQTSSKENQCYAEDQLILSQVADSQGWLPTSLPEDEMATFTSIVGSEKSESNSVGEDLAKSMMSFLLPQAVPLLKKATKKKKANINALVSGHLMTIISPVIDTDNPSLMDTEASLPLTQKETDFNREGCESSCIVSTGMQDVVPSTKKHTCPLSESIICRNFGDDCSPEGYPASGTILEAQKSQENFLNKSSNAEVSSGAEASLKRKRHSFRTENSSVNAEGTTVCDKSHNQALEFRSVDRHTTEYAEATPLLIEKCHSSLDNELVRQLNLEQFNASDLLFQDQGNFFCNNRIIDNEDSRDSSDLKPRINEGSKSELEKLVELVGCYEHSMPISSVLSSITEKDIYICVLCSPLMERDGTLFIYKLPIKGPRDGCPSFIGHASITIPFSRDTFGGRMSLERSGLHFTPDGQCLVLHNSIKVPYCREGKTHCSCSACTADCAEENAIKIVKMKLGYVSLVAKMKTLNCVLSILVCNPSRIVAVEEGGRLYLWVMNSAWSTHTEEFIIPTSDCISPCVKELKRIPKCAHLVIGHNGYGEFGLWDISKRILISRFSAPSKSVSQFLPISLFGWDKKDPSCGNLSVKDETDKIMAATKVSFDNSENITLHPSIEKEMGIWLLVSTFPDSDAQFDSEATSQMYPVGWWRLALLVNNVVIWGSILDQRISVIGAIAGHGISATCDGLVYMWEISTGTKLGTLHNFKEGGVSCIAADDSKSGVFAVAGDGGHLLVYLCRQRET